MADSFTAELHGLIDRAFTAEYGSRANAQMVYESVFADMPPHLVENLVGKGLRSQIRAYFNEKDQDGLPKRPEVNEDGEHAQLEFATVAEFAYVHGRYVERADANLAQARKVRDRCLDVHGVDLAKQSAAS